MLPICVTFYSKVDARAEKREKSLPRSQSCKVSKSETDALARACQDSRTNYVTVLGCIGILK